MIVIVGILIEEYALHVGVKATHLLRSGTSTLSLSWSMQNPILFIEMLKMATWVNMPSVNILLSPLLYSITFPTSIQGT